MVEDAYKILVLWDNLFNSTFYYNLDILDLKINMLFILVLMMEIFLG